MVNPAKSLHRVLESTTFDQALRRLSELELLKAVEDLYTARGLGKDDVVDLKLMKRGALLAQNSMLPKPTSQTDDEPAHCILQSGSDFHQTQTSGHDVQANNESVASEQRTSADILLAGRDRVLKGSEDKALKREKVGANSSLPKGLVITLATCAIGAIVQ
ncbi:hypothetical protein BP6252_08026 [Coleophoma cylindrospora]|uniref:Uncharacterized protein n=1 Tax=Coleophoma cylindrospora TaxID=1849047 RepID=A0A3D8RBM9_9HELO|nr:hypothetical protein BP6252_08026 [Coleophoma cylindrospora]